MTLLELKFAALALTSASEQTKLFAWWLHTHGGKQYWKPADISRCFDDLHIGGPNTIGPYIARLVDKKELLKDKNGYRLEAKQRAALDQSYGVVSTSVAIKSLLADLPSKLPTLSERTYLDEALRCYQANAMRAAIVMTWNLAYAHLCNHIVKNHMAAFNTHWQTAFSGDHKNGQRSIKTVDDFAGEELGEHKVLKIALNSGAIVKNVYNVLEPALKRRNAAAHPNNVILNSLQTDAFIEDLVNNAILKIV